MNYRYLILFSAVFCALLAFVPGPRPAQADYAPDMTMGLHRGLNLSSWLANAPRQPATARDFLQIKQAGFDHVRLPFNPTYFGYTLSRDGGDADKLDFVPLDRAIALAEQYHLPVILDLHPGGEFMDTLENNGWAEDEYVALWKAMAEHYKDHSGSALIFELLNEPQYYKNEARWNRLSTRLIEAVFSITPHRAIIVGSPHGSSIDGLSYLHPVSDPRILYSFHYYEPHLLTHQGIHQGFEKKAIRFFRNLPYPSSLATQSAAIYAPTAPDLEQAASELQEYKDAPWDGAQIAKQIDVAHEWATSHHVRLLCGEFGVLRNHIEKDSRYRWIEDARSALDKDNIGWELWDYTDLFGIAPPANPSDPDPVDGSVHAQNQQRADRHFEPEALKALGLNTTGAR